MALMRRVWAVLLVAVAACSESRPPPSQVTAPLAGPRTMVLWFPDQTGRRVSSEGRQFTPSASNVLRELAAGPRSPDLAAVPPAEVDVSAGTAKVAFSPPVGERVVRQAVALSLLEVADVRVVEIDGAPEPREPELVAPVTLSAPPPGSRLVAGSTVTVSGTAAAFEGTVSWFLRNGSATILDKGFVTTVGDRRSGFEIHLAVPSVAAETPATLQVYSSYSAVGEQSYSRRLSLVLLPR